ncbi:hypothetical protein P170DRAFT_346594 [Aspergillus steynii IBT 23096]|uniref:Uncharacterized protein n=1 Tax=Aspergillus steynii IBT 23096 TaxID=1392250 RepID=A0A2I2GLY1_9EURO|nr:uncharacterized protein P170DRAFT_346594 [Aspergillus steynii IBT 23096]PLB53888.1 hypothetical protein P170DRAFT_346594 [Aspergillus steynii IBT 23096]
MAYLPNEVLQEIFSYFCLHCYGDDESTISPAHLRDSPQDPDARSWHSLDYHTLSCLCLASRGFCAVAQPILYHEFAPGHGDSWRSNFYSWNGRLASFLLTLSRRRDIAAKVKKVYIHPRLLKFAAEDDAQDMLSEAARALQIKDQLELSTQDMLALVIALLPSLQHLSLQVNESLENPVRWSALHATGNSCLQLKTVDVGMHSSGSGFFNDREFCASGLLSSCAHLETLNIHLRNSDWFKPLDVSLPGIKTTISVTDTRLSAKELNRLLQSCTGLRGFAYKVAPPDISIGECYYENYGNHFDPLDGIQYLSRHHETLESIHLDLNWWKPAFVAGERNSWPRHQPVINFQGFTALRHLFLSAGEIYDLSYEEPPPLVDLLPQSIVSLHFGRDMRPCDPGLLHGIEGLATAVSDGLFPNLKKVRCPPESGMPDPIVARAMFVAAGVDFGYDNSDLSKANPYLPSDRPLPSTPMVLDADGVWRFPWPDEDPDL